MGSSDMNKRSHIDENSMGSPIGQDMDRIDQEPDIKRARIIDDQAYNSE